jgi:hypothetical protein
MLYTKINPRQNLAQFSLLRHNLSLQNIITRWVVFISWSNVKIFELNLFFQHTDWPLEWTTNHHQALNIWVPQCTLAQFGSNQLNLSPIVKLWTYCLWETVLSKRIRVSQHIFNIESPALAQLSTIPHNQMKLQNWILFTKMSPTVHFGTIWLNLTQFGTLCTIEHNMD